MIIIIFLFIGVAIVFKGTEILARYRYPKIQLHNVHQHSDEQNTDKLGVYEFTDGALDFIRLEEERLEEERLEEERIAAEKLEEERLRTLITELETPFELPLKNSMGISITSTKVYSGTDTSSNIIQSVVAGDVFLIQEEMNSNWLRVITEGGDEGYVQSALTMINLPDIIPSIIYEIPNSDGSTFVSSGYSISQVTGNSFYNCNHYNNRLQRDEYIVPVMYAMASKIQLAQLAALQDGNTLIMYESYRPYNLQTLVGKQLEILLQENQEVEANINKSPWHKGWFIATGISNHQKGLAVDISLGRVMESIRTPFGDMEYNVINQWEEYQMQTDIFELSSLSASLSVPVSWSDKDAWKSVAVDPRMTKESLLLREYCDNANLSPIASEWWHFNDVDELLKTSSLGINYAVSIQFTKCISVQ